MIILAIETSCDDTCLALVKAEGKKQVLFKILANIVSSQVKIHKKWGGVYPTLAKREHQKNLPIVLKKGLREAKIPAGKIDLIALTVGPGLEPCLWTGINFAKNLAKKLNLPIIPINHIEAHIFANFLKPKINLLFPAISLIVSGGHTQLILMRDFGNYKILGETRDDAAGECLDKVARILGLGYPGGPVISRLAAKAERFSALTRRGEQVFSSKTDREKFSVRLPRPMIHQKNYDFSFSGLKTAVFYDFQKRSEKVRKSKKYIQEMATETQQAVIDVLISKTLRAANDFQAKTIILGGGVVANDQLRKQFKKATKESGFKLLIPAKKFSTDNGVMVAVTAYFHWLRGGRKWLERKEIWKEIEAKANLRI